MRTTISFPRGGKHRLVLSQEQRKTLNPAAVTEEKNSDFKQEAISYLDHLYRVAFHLTRERADAEDLVQETYLQAVTHDDQFTPGTNLKGWLSKILYNLFINRYRRDKRTVSLDRADAETGVSWLESLEGSVGKPETELLQAELQDKILEALNSLQEEFRSPVVLVDIGGFTYAEVAEILSCPVGTIRSRLFRARSILASELRSYVRQER
jgi:RNA polymerase sigma-70 factor (ECF subfamily)